MGTHGRIGIVLNDGSVKSIYNHWDSYPSYLGKMLLDNYKDEGKVSKLIELGDCSSVSEEVDIPEGMKHTFNEPLDNVTISYMRDHGEKGCKARIDNSEKDFWESNIEEYGYLFKDGKWFVATSHGRYDKKTDEYIDIPANKRKVIELTDDVCEKELQFLP